MEPPAPSLAHAGLCARCAHAEVVRSGRGSVFVRCARSDHDPRFPRYPVLPRLTCPGHEPGAPNLRAGATAG